MNLISYWIFLGIALCWIHALSLALRPRNQPDIKVLIGILIALAFIQWELWLQVTDSQQPINTRALIYFIHQPCLYLPGPLLYIYAQTLLQQGAIPSSLKYHLVPAALIALYSFAEYVLWDGETALTFGRWLTLCCFGTGAVYASLLLSTLRRFTHSRSLIRLEFALLSVIISIGIGVSIIAIIGGLLNSPMFYQLYASAITFIMIAVFLISNRYPELTTVVAEEIIETLEIEKNPQSHLNNIDIQHTISRLQDLMQTQQLHKQENISLATLASAMDMNGHQLSQLLNKHLHTNFNNYLKSYRIEEAKKLLIHSHEQSITDIGFDIGFNSTSTFYKAFRDATGLAPGQFRKQNSEKTS